MELILSLCLVLFVSVNCVCSDSTTSSSSSSSTISSTSSSSSSSDCDENYGLYRTVETHNGAVRGIRKRTLFQNISYYAFLGIPYAEKPIHDLRFKAPIPIASWKPNVLDAFEYGNSCIQQASALGNSGPQSENCLFLNIFVPANNKSQKKFPVMFFIHGGGFSEGSGNDFFYGPDFLLEKGLIVVTINYRLGTFGFMSLNTKHHSGNMGLKDQQLALKWTHHNIAAFGGHKQRITLMGQSAGAASVHYHVLFQQSRKLIRGAICLSGSAFLRYTYLDEKSHVKKMYDFAKKSNSSIKHMHELVDFLENVPSQQIVESLSQASYDRTLIFDWAPMIEKKSSNRPILLKTPQELYDSNRFSVNVNTMFGYTNYECLSLVWADVSNSTRLNEFLKDFNLVLPVHKLKPQFKSKSYRQLLNRVYNHYMGNVTTERDKAMQFVNMISDLNMVGPIDRAVKTQAMHSERPTFYYQFSVDGKLDYIKHTLNIKWPGASHCDDLCFIFRCHSIDSVYYDVKKTLHHDEKSKISYNTIQHMTQMIANFAKHGRPTVDGSPTRGYHPVCGHQVNFLDITNDAMIPGVSPKKDAVRFWNRILQKAERLVR